MNKYIFIILTLLIPVITGVLGVMDNTQEFSYPFILGFMICFILYFPYLREKNKW